MLFFVFYVSEALGGIRVNSCNNILAAALNGSSLLIGLSVRFTVKIAVRSFPCKFHPEDIVMKRPACGLVFIKINPSPE